MALTMTFERLQSTTNGRQSVPVASTGYHHGIIVVGREYRRALTAEEMRMLHLAPIEFDGDKDFIELPEEGT